MIGSIVGKNKALGLALAYSLLYAVTVVANQVVVRDKLHPVMLNWVASMTAFGLGWGIRILGGGKSKRLKWNKGLSWAVGVGVLSAGVADMMVLYGLRVASSVNWSILISMSPIVTYLLCVLLMGERWVKYRLVAILVSVAGAVMVVLVPGSRLKVGWGDMLFLGALVTYSVMNIMSQKGLAEANVKDFTVVRLMASAVTMSVMMGVLRPGLNLNYLWYAVLFGGLMYGGISMINMVVRMAGATFFALANNMVPVMVLVLSGLFLGEWANLWQLVGGIIVIFGVVWFLRIRNKR